MTFSLNFGHILSIFCVICGSWLTSVFGQSSEGMQYSLYEEPLLLGEGRSLGLFAPPIPYSAPQTSLADLESAINAETVRIVTNHLAFVLYHKEEGSEVRRPNHWPLMQKMGKVLLTSCPSLNPYVLRGMMRMFRHLVQLNVQPSSGTLHPNDQGQNERILEALDKCAQNGSTSPIADQPCQNYTSSWLPEDVQFKIGQKENPNSGHDFPIETIWKVLLFSHYRCAPYFRAHPLDLSALYMKMELLFNQGIRYRWTRSGYSLDAFQEAFLSYDLTRFAQTLDNCVYEAKAGSPYMGWLKRPAHASSANSTG